ncbi:MAG: TRAP transporter substrate-binding protein DctP [Actinomycetota bacterium]
MPTLLLLLAAVVACLAPDRAQADGPRIIVLAHTQVQDAAADPAAAMASVFKRQVEQATGGAVRVDLFPEGMVGGNREMARLVGANTIQSALVTVGGVTPVYPPLAVVQMPFAFDSADAAYGVYDGPFGRRLAAEIEAHTGMAVLGFGDSGGFHVITNSRGPVHGAKDLAGLKLRTIPGAEVIDAMIRAFGATPVRVGSREELTALASGIVDGQMNPPMVLLNRRYDQVQRYVTLTNHLYLPYVWLFNRQALDELPSEHRQAVRAAATAAIAAGRALSRQGTEGGLPALYRRMEVVTPTPAERAAMKAAVQPAVRAAIAKTLGDDGIRLLDDFLAAAKGR